MTDMVVKLRSGINLNYKAVFQFEKIYDKGVEGDVLHISGQLNGTVCYDKHPLKDIKVVEFK